MESLGCASDMMAVLVKDVEGSSEGGRGVGGGGPASSGEVVRSSGSDVRAPDCVRRAAGG